MSSSAKRKLEALSFWEKHGVDATCDAFNVSRSSLYAWRQHCRRQGTRGLGNRSTAPRVRRRRSWPPEVTDQIRHLRQGYPLGPQKLHTLIRPWCVRHGLPCPSPRTIARLIQDAPDRMRIVPHIARRTPTALRERKPRLGKGFQATHPGHCIAIDTIQRFVDGHRRYLFTAVDHHSRFSFAIAVKRSNSQAAAFFMGLVAEAFPGRIAKVLTDNGSEFRGAFDEWLAKHGIQHCWTYPRCPDMNPFNERFNRTLQEEYVSYAGSDPVSDIRSFNHDLIDYLVWFNTRRPHYGLNMKTPMQVLSTHLPSLSNMSWHHTLILT